MLQRDVDHRFVTVFLVEDVGRHQPLALTRPERVQVDVVALQPHAGVVERGDSRSSHEDASALARSNESEHARGFVAAARHDHDVVDFADRGSAGVKQRQPHDAICVDEVGCGRHEARLPMRRGTTSRILMIFFVDDSRNFSCECRRA